jgi:hypothetical protein
MIHYGRPEIEIKLEFSDVMIDILVLFNRGAWLALLQLPVSVFDLKTKD